MAFEDIKPRPYKALSWAMALVEAGIVMQSAATRDASTVSSASEAERRRAAESTLGESPWKLEKVWWWAGGGPGVL